MYQNIISWTILMLQLSMIHGLATQAKESDDMVKVQTDCGPVEGKRYSETILDTQVKSNVYEFRNIPYAVPPVSDLRWRPPIPLSKDQSQCWTGTLKYDSETVIACQQINPRLPSLKGSEDCLVVTVRTPSLDAKAKLPVLYWIHGGGMDWGFNEMFAYHPDREFTASMNAVTVSVNYRLNIFGFLSLKELWIDNGDGDDSYGNYGIMDIILGLRWVQNNIERFGGDPNQVTIYGESGGGTAVYCLLSSPLADGLFQKASPSSGAPNIRVTHKEANVIYRGYIDKANCSFEMSSQIKDCLQTTNTDFLLHLWNSPTLNYHKEFPANVPYKGHPIEILDPIVVTQSPDQILLSSKTDIDILIGNDAQEIGPFPGAPSPVADINTWSDLQQKLEAKMNTFKTGLYPIALDLYTKNTSSKIVPGNVTPAYVYEIMSSDVLLICSTSDVAKHLRKIPAFNVYRFIVSQPATRNIGLGVTTAYHGWDSVALFGLKFFSGKVLPNDDKQLMLNIRKIYRSFLHSCDVFLPLYVNKVMEFWNNDVIVWNHEYHEHECKIWRENDLLKFAWGNIGI